MKCPRPTPIFRLLHIESLETIVRRGALHAPNCAPNDGLPFRSIHRPNVQQNRRPLTVPCGRGGFVGDYASFYLGPRSVMLLNLKTGRVPGYTEGQEPLVYLVSTVEAVVGAGQQYAFTDRHSLAAYVKWTSVLGDLDGLDWATIYANTWNRTLADPERQNRKQAEFLVHGQVAWGLFHEIAVVNPTAEARVRALLAKYRDLNHPAVVVRPAWYY